jgi:hypothetical protein
VDITDWTRESAEDLWTTNILNDAFAGDFTTPSEVTVHFVNAKADGISGRAAFKKALTDLVKPTVDAVLIVFTYRPCHIQQLTRIQKVSGFLNTDHNPAYIKAWFRDTLHAFMENRAAQHPLCHRYTVEYVSYLNEIKKTNRSSSLAGHN